MFEMTDFILWGAAFFAGFVDAVAGGGGLIQLPALLIFRPEMSVVGLLGTNKLSSICGTSAAVWKYDRSKLIPWKLVLPAAAFAFLGSVAGAMTVVQVTSNFLKPLILVLLTAIFIYTILKPRFGNRGAKKKIQQRDYVFAFLFGGLIGFYDGFFGPGAGSFLIFGFVFFLSFELLKASASAKVINLGTNLGALIYFGSKGHLNIPLGLTMGIFNLAGGWAGSHTAIRQGASFVRYLFYAVVAGAILRLVWSF